MYNENLKNDLEIELIELEDLENLKRDIKNSLNDLDVKFSQLIDELIEKIDEIKSIENRIDEKLNRLEAVENRLDRLEKKLDDKLEFLKLAINQKKEINNCEEVLRGFKEAIDKVLEESSKDKKEILGVDISYNKEIIFSKNSVVGDEKELETPNGLLKLNIDGEEFPFSEDSKKVVLKVAGYKKIYIGDKLKDLSKKRGGINGKKS